MSSQPSWLHFLYRFFVHWLFTFWRILTTKLVDEGLHPIARSHPRWATQPVLPAPYKLNVNRPLPISVGHMFDFRLPPFHNPQNCGQNCFYGNWTEAHWMRTVSKVDRAITWLKRRDSEPTAAIPATAFPPRFSSFFRFVLGLCNFLWAQLSLWTWSGCIQELLQYICRGGWGGETAASVSVRHAERYFPIKIGLVAEFPYIKYYLPQLLKLFNRRNTFFGRAYFN